MTSPDIAIIETVQRWKTAKTVQKLNSTIFFPVSFF